MPQTFQVLRCYKCEVFQVHATKKSNKWKCKLCDQKQSIKRFYGLGTGRECRLHVQKLNGIRGDLDGTHSETDTSEHGPVSDSPDKSVQHETPSYPIAKKSKWLNYVDTEAEDNPKTEEEQVSPYTIMHPSNAEVLLELPKNHQNKCLTVTTQIKNKPNIECLQEKNLHSASLSNNRTSVSSSLTKSMQENKANVRTCKTNATNNLQACTIANNSKWAKFVEGTQNCNDENEVVPITCKCNQSNPMFPFLEDDDIDSILDF